ncbi:CDP-glycerol glycerophosphotransferase family protein, partial [Bacteroidota bacterium]
MDYKLLLKYHQYIQREISVSEPKTLFSRIASEIYRFSLKSMSIVVGGFLTRIFGIKSKKVDILVFNTNKIDFQNTELIWNILKERGYSVRLVLPSVKQLFLAALFFRDKLKIPYKIYYWSVFSRYLIKKFEPGIICSFKSYDVMPSFLRKHAQASCKTVFLPHGLQPPIHLYTSFDYDYYLAFGKGGLKCIEDNKLRIGSTKVILSGSPIIKKHYSLDPGKPTKNILFFSDWWIEKNYQNTVRNLEIVIDWAKENPDYKLLIKLHPSEKGEFIKDQVNSIQNITVLDKSISMVEALINISICITAWSVASIEAALLNRPTVVVNHLEYDESSDNYIQSDKYLYIESFFPRRAVNSSELKLRIEQVLKNYDYYLEQCKKF